MNNQQIASIPRPLVKTNQWVIVLSVIATLITGQFFILLIPLLAGLIGLLTGNNPVMMIAKKFLKKPLSSYIPEDKAQQQFNQLIAVVCLSIAFISSIIGWTILSYSFAIIVGLAATIALCGFCIGCFIHFQYNQYKYRRSLRS
ncbi:DUF4395 domain-containing protein [Cytobacillus sp. FSL M8-0252]|uniref:DUF4395 domain-containing protein n=1 Tax=Cytobacillus sp. FSL M8-0252 TaxID=2921621 RepID=UPI0030F7E617